MDRHAITAALRRAGSSQAEIGRRLGVSRMAVCRVVAGETKTPYIRRAIARKLRMKQSTIWPDAKRGSRRRKAA